MRNSRLKKEARKLFDENLEPKEIIKKLRELGSVSDPTVYRWLKEFNEEIESDTVVSEEDSTETQGVEIETQEDSLESDEKLSKDDNELLEIRKAKRKTLKLAKDTLEKLLEFKETDKWEYERIGEFLIKFKEIQDQIEFVLKYNPELYQENLLWNVVTDFINQFTQLRRSGDKSPVNHSDILNLQKRIFLELLDDLEEFDAPHDLTIEFISKLKSYLIDFLGCVGKEAGKEKCTFHISHLDQLIEYADQTHIADELEDDIQALKQLREELNSHAINKTGFWADSNLKLSSPLQESLMRMAENNVVKVNS